MKKTIGEGKYLFAEEKKNGERKLREKFGEGKYTFIEEKDKEENIWRCVSIDWSN